MPAGLPATRPARYAGGEGFNREPYAQTSGFGGGNHRRFFVYFFYFFYFFCLFRSLIYGRFRFCLVPSFLIMNRHPKSTVVFLLVIALGCATSLFGQGQDSRSIEERKPETGRSDPVRKRVDVPVELIEAGRFRSIVDLDVLEAGQLYQLDLSIENQTGAPIEIGDIHTACACRHFSIDGQVVSISSCGAQGTAGGQQRDVDF